MQSTNALQASTSVNTMSTGHGSNSATPRPNAGNQMVGGGNLTPSQLVQQQQQVAMMQQIMGEQRQQQQMPNAASAGLAGLAGFAPSASPGMCQQQPNNMGLGQQGQYIGGMPNQQLPSVYGFNAPQLAALGLNPATTMSQLQQLMTAQQNQQQQQQQQQPNTTGGTPEQHNQYQQQLGSPANQGLLPACNNITSMGDIYAPSNPAAAVATAMQGMPPGADPSQLAAIAGISAVPGMGTITSAATSSAMLTADTSRKGGGGSSGGGKEPPFPVKLHRILSNPEFKEIISWLPHGRSWRVLKPKAFEERIIPLYFRHAKYASFMRQVNGWGFKRMTQGPDHNSYYHEQFLRGMPQQCAKMKRPPKTKLSVTEDVVKPDFYKLSRINPLPDIDGSPAPAPNQDASETVSAAAAAAAAASLRPNGVSGMSEAELHHQLNQIGRSKGRKSSKRSKTSGKGDDGADKRSDASKDGGNEDAAEDSESKRRADLVRQLKEVMGEEEPGDSSSGRGAGTAMQRPQMNQVAPPSNIAAHQMIGMPPQQQQQAALTGMIGALGGTGNPAAQTLLLQQHLQQNPALTMQLLQQHQQHHHQQHHLLQNLPQPLAQQQDARIQDPGKDQSPDTAQLPSEEAKKAKAT